MRRLIVSVVLWFTHTLGAQQEAPSPTFCSAQDSSFVATYHLYASLAAVMTFFLAFYGIPKALSFQWWWLTKSVHRLLILTAVLFPLIGVLLSLPWLEAEYGVGLGVSVLPWFQVEYRYLECRSVEFSRPAYLWGDFAKSAFEPAVYLISYQVITIVMIFILSALVTYLIHHLLVKWSISTASKRLGRVS